MFIQPSRNIIFQSFKECRDNLPFKTLKKLLAIYVYIHKFTIINIFQTYLYFLIILKCLTNESAYIRER